MAKELGFVIEQNICTGCKACQVACKDKNNLEVGRLFRTVKSTEGGSFTKKGEALEQDVVSYWTTLACNHCQEPVCVQVCPTGAMYKRKDDGIVLVDIETCIGCGACENACPYDAPVLDVEAKKMGKCDFCVDLIIQGKDPICAGACPVRAIKYGEIEELRKEYGDIDTMEGIPEPDTKPCLVIVPHKDAQF